MAATHDWGHFRHEIAELPTGELHYHRAGTGRPLVYCHSAGGPRPSRVLFGLAERREVFALVQPGFDGTPRHPGVTEIGGLIELAAGFMKSRFDGPVDVMGESFGGWIALRLAARHPELVDRLVLEAPAGLRDHPPEGPIRIFAHEATAPPPSVHEEANVASARSYESGRYDPELAESLGRIVAPTLVLYGTEDNLLPEYAVRRVEEGLPNARLVLIAGAGHGLEYDAPDRVLALVREFLDRGAAAVQATPATEAI
jgi:4,5:9,10-diseco-3-hydroxy-5,9,17-trioxoandrosta-1(10),2-diene-4-oate hydrolase